jgi:predicted glutamine amidotransferase
MCGLLGFASSEKMNNRSLRKSFLFSGFPLNATDRGMESSGLAMVKDLGKTPIIYKKAMWGGDFIMHSPVQRYLNDVEDYSVVLGHVRAATSGRGNISDYNAHPFQYDHITLVHNGHIRNANILPHSNEADCLVDSAMVAHSMARNGEMETLEKVEGGFVFIWWNSDEKTLNIARNEERPLHLAYIKNENSLFWTSECTALAHLLRGAEVDDKGLLYPGTMIWYKYTMDDLRKVVKTPFVHRQGWHPTPVRNWTAGTPGDRGTSMLSDDEEAAAWEEYGTQQDKDTDAENGSEMDEIREDISKQRGKDARRNGIPTAKKRVERAKVELRKLGYEFDQLKIVEPISWTKYHNQQMYGSVLGRFKSVRTVGDGKGVAYDLCEIVSVSLEDYNIMAERRFVAVRCGNVRMTKENATRPRIVAYVDQETFDKSRRALQSDPLSETEETPRGPIDRHMFGPSGRKVSLDRWKELTKHGCGNCQRDFEPDPLTGEASNGQIYWGPGDAPICWGCQSPDILKSIVPDQNTAVNSTRH